ncbi:unnamed protein product [Diabrotica balteata]|uniref:Uncharacterized protein n=1 Tax=Diabrotica balteata TaxID=107213 RepID=A0A9N9TG03_DIABA|nr:unnamed protein product [Diabrotica balteata]
MNARKVYSDYTREQKKTGGGQGPTIPAEIVMENKDIMNPAELLRDHNVYDSDGPYVNKGASTSKGKDIPCISTPIRKNFKNVERIISKKVFRSLKKKLFPQTNLPLSSIKKLENKDLLREKRQERRQQKKVVGELSQVCDTNHTINLNESNGNGTDSSSSLTISTISGDCLPINFPSTSLSEDSSSNGYVCCFD